MSETTTRRAIPPRRKLTHALAYTLAIALPLLALCYIAGDTFNASNTRCPYKPELGYDPPDAIGTQHGFPFVLMLDTKIGCYEQVRHEYYWFPWGVVADAVLWVGVAWLCYWLLSGLGQTIRSLRR